MNRGQTGIDLVVLGSAQEIRAAISEKSKNFVEGLDDECTL